MWAVRLMRFTVLPAFVAAGLSLGCGKKLSPYPALSSPQSVLSALSIAYSHRDSTETKALYDSSYVGTSEDLNDPPWMTPLSFSYSDEVGHVAALARSPTISSVSLNFGPQGSWTRLESNDPSHPEWAVIQIAGSSFYVECTDGDNTWQAGGMNEFLEFMFKPSTPESTSPTDTLWRIVRWRESRAAGP